MDYALEKLRLAIFDLTIGEGNIKERLLTATKNLTELSENDFPEPLRQDWNSIFTRLTKKESPENVRKYGEGNFEATICGMRKSTASKIAIDIVIIDQQLYNYIKEGL